MNKIIVYAILLVVSLLLIFVSFYCIDYDRENRDNRFFKLDYGILTGIGAGTLPLWLIVFCYCFYNLIENI